MNAIVVDGARDELDGLVVEKEAVVGNVE